MPRVPVQLAGGGVGLAIFRQVIELLTVSGTGRPQASRAGVNLARERMIRQVALSSVDEPLDPVTRQSVTRPSAPISRANLTVPCSPRSRAEAG